MGQESQQTCCVVWVLLYIRGPPPGHLSGVTCPCGNTDDLPECAAAPGPLVQILSRTKASGTREGLPVDAQMGREGKRKRLLLATGRRGSLSGRSILFDCLMVSRTQASTKLELSLTR